MYTDVSIIFPALNEKERIVPTLEDYISVLGDDIEYIVVDNGSTDGTKEIVTKRFPQVTYIRSETPLGKGGAVYEGFNVAKGSIVGFSDPDGATSAREFSKLLDGILENDMVIGSRWLPESRIVPMQPIFRQVNSRLFNCAVRALLPLTLRDTQCGAKVLKKSVYETVKPHLTHKQFSFDVDLLHQVNKHGFTIAEIPITWRHVEGGSTFKPFRSGIKAVVDVGKIFLKHVE